MAATIVNTRALCMTSISTDIPPGFEPHFRQSPLTDPWEPLYSKRTDKAVIIGLRLAKPHTNAHGLIHGGGVSAHADKAMGYRWAATKGGTSFLVTRGCAAEFIATPPSRPLRYGVPRGRKTRR